MLQRRNDVVGIVTRLGAGTSEFRVQAGQENFFLVHKLQIGSRAHAASQLMVTGRSSLGVKRPETGGLPLISM